MYKGNLGVNAVGDQIDILKDHFNQDFPEDAKLYKKITFSAAKKMIEEAKEVVEEMAEQKKPKKRGRPKKEA